MSAKIKRSIKVDKEIKQDLIEDRYDTPFDKQKRQLLDYLVKQQNSRLEQTAVDKRDSKLVNDPNVFYVEKVKDSSQKRKAKTIKTLTDSILVNQAQQQDEIEKDNTASQNVASSILDKPVPSLLDEAGVLENPNFDATTFGQLPTLWVLLKQLDIPDSVIQELQNIVQRLPEIPSTEEKKTITNIKDMLQELEGKIKKSKKSSKEDKDFAKNTIQPVVVFLNNLSKLTDDSIAKILSSVQTVEGVMQKLYEPGGLFYNQAKQTIDFLSQQGQQDKKGQQDKGQQDNDQQQDDDNDQQDSQMQDERMILIEKQNKGQQVLNPETNRPIKVGSKIWKGLVKYYGSDKLRDDGTFNLPKKEQITEPPKKPRKISLSDSDLEKGKQGLKKSTSSSSSQDKDSEAEKDLQRQIAEISSLITKQTGTIRQLQVKIAKQTPNKRGATKNKISEEQQILNGLVQQRRDLQEQLKGLKGSGLPLSRRPESGMYGNDIKIAFTKTREQPRVKYHYRWGQHLVNKRKWDDGYLHIVNKSKRVQASGSLSEGLKFLLTKPQITSKDSDKFNEVDLEHYRKLLKLVGFTNQDKFPNNYRKTLIFSLKPGETTSFVYFDNPDDLLTRLEVLSGEQEAGNDSPSIRNEISSILTILKNKKTISPEEYIQLSEKFL